MATRELLTGVKEKWLVRTEKNQITGPLSRESVQKLIQEGQLGFQDEVCRNDSYWIYLHEADEVQKQLGLIVPRTKTLEEDDEETETEILSVGFVSSAEGTSDSSEAESLALAPEQEAEIPDLGESVGEETSALSNRAFRQIKARKEPVPQSRATDTVPEFFQANVKIGTERSTFWRGFAVFLVALVIILLIAMVWVLKSP